MYQVPDDRRTAFFDQITTIGCHWVSVEHPDLIPLRGKLPVPPREGFFNVLTLDGKPLAWVRGHGESLTWIG